VAPWLRATGEIRDETCAPLVGQCVRMRAPRRLPLGVEALEDSRPITLPRPTGQDRFEFGIVRFGQFVGRERLAAS